MYREPPGPEAPNHGPALSLKQRPSVPLSQDCRGEAPRTATVAKLAQVNALPRTQAQTALCYGQADRTTHERSFDMRRHVIGPFERMLVIRCALRHQFVEAGSEIAAHRGIGILIESETGRRMLNEQVQQAHYGQFGKRGLDMVGYQVEAAGIRRQMEGHLLPGRSISHSAYPPWILRWWVRTIFSVCRNDRTLRHLPSDIP